MNYKKLKLILFTLLMQLSLVGCYIPPNHKELTVIESPKPTELPSKYCFDDEIPSFSGNASIAINNDHPYFTEDEKACTDSFEQYSDLDSLGRVGVAYANIGKDLMPTEDRGSISEVKPTGWVNKKYDSVDGGWLYNRCHLIGFQLTGENANEKNLMTGTRYFNVEGMLPFENMVADYIKETGNHVLYRVTPKFTGNNLVADGVLMEGYSVEDNGKRIEFCAFVYNVQPGITIDYATGESSENDASASIDQSSSEQTAVAQNSSDVSQKYILNISSKKFHKSDCSTISKMSEKNKEVYTGTRDSVIAMGYSPCKTCNP